MKLEIKSLVKNTYEKFTIEITESDIVFDLKKSIFSKIEGKIPLDQIEIFFYLNSKNLESKIILDNNNLNIIEFYPEIKNKKLYLNKKQKQFNKIHVNLIEYSIPMILIIIFVYFKGICNLNIIQKYSILMIFFHFLKRDFESFFIHIHSKSIDFFLMLIEFFYYIFYFGIFCCFNLIFDNKNKILNKKKFFWLILFFISEICNFHCHLILRNLRIFNNNEIKIPKGNLFKFVYKANYFWEILIWFSIAFFNNLKSFYAFAILGSFVMIFWAMEEKKKFDEKFGKNLIKKAIFPFIL
jgi:hypothetical protein